MRKFEFGSIQYLRGFAALMVVFQHSFAHLAYVAGKYFKKIDLGAFDGLHHIGNSGVDLFFVISGFVMAASTERVAAGWVSAARFLRRRALRILPLYWIFLTVYLSLSIVSEILSPGAMETEKNYSLSYLARSYFLVPAYNQDLVAPYLGVGWSLYFELYFYLMVGCVIAYAAGARTWWLSGILLVIVVIGARETTVNPIAVVVTSPLVIEFLLGWAIFSIFCTREDRLLTRPAAYALILLGLALFIFSIFYYPYSGIYDSARVLSWGIPSALIVIGLVSIEQCGSKFQSRKLLLLGAASYSIYLSHKALTFPALNKIFAFGVFSLPYGALWFASLVLGSVCIGVLVHKLVEVPLQRNLISRA